METGLITPSSELKRTPNLGQALLVIVGTALLIGVGFGFYKVKVELLLVVATALTGCMAWWLGLGWREMQSGMMQSILKGLLRDADCGDRGRLDRQLARRSARSR